MRILGSLSHSLHHPTFCHPEGMGFRGSGGMCGVWKVGCKEDFKGSYVPAFGGWSSVCRVSFRPFGCVSRNPLSSGPCPTIRSNSNSQGRPTKYILDLIFASWIFSLRFFTSPWLADNNSQRILHIYYLLCGTG